MNNFKTMPKKNNRKLTTKEKWLLTATIIVAVIAAIAVSSFVKNLFV